MLLPRILPIALLLGSAARGQDVSKPLHVVRASGEATVTAKPDRAQITIGVVTQAPTAEAASAQNAEQTTQMLDAIKPVLGSGGEIKTSGYSVNPAYQTGKSGAPPKIVGYNSSNAVLVTIDDLRLVSKILDAAAKAGANNINGISFTLRDDQGARSEALAQAAVKARESAEAIAKALNLRVTGVVQAETSGGSNVLPLYRRAMPLMAQSNEVPTPIETGDIEVNATVIVTLAVQ
ncbi:MAG TPA: SIMPL domain-containing protein [Bryobacteraceae bacterium]|nr:SIMPL domain-containing protein [Bryobacteraceae bacterium]